jgi:hypothetical protein
MIRGIAMHFLKRQRCSASSGPLRGCRPGHAGDRLLVAFTVFTALVWVAVLVYSIWS